MKELYFGRNQLYQVFLEDIQQGNWNALDVWSKFVRDRTCLDGFYPNGNKIDIFTVISASLMRV